MVIPADLSARILRLHEVEHWRVGTIARQLHVHRDTVRRVLAQAGSPAPATPLRPSRVDPYRAFILETLTKFPTLTAARLFVMVHERGYRGSPEHFRHLVAGMRPRRAAEAYLRLRTLPGEQAQVDWAHFGHLQIGRARRPLMAFLMVLSYSRLIFLRFFMDARMDSFLRGHVEAFSAWDGCPRVILYDNLRSVVLERIGDAVRFNPELLRFAAHHFFEPRPVAVARGNEKEWSAWCTSSVSCGAICISGGSQCSKLSLVTMPNRCVGARRLIQVVVTVIEQMRRQQPRPAPSANRRLTDIEAPGDLGQREHPASAQPFIATAQRVVETDLAHDQPRERMAAT